MKKFELLDSRPVNEVESDILSHWQETDIYNQTVNNRSIENNFVFYDGPAFANGFPGLHHMVAKNLKDSICKYHTMQGKRIIRKVGWDTHGLPIEMHVEHKLGITDKKDIEAMGIENFNNECKKSVRENESAFIDLTLKMGQFIDVKNPYLTFKDDYIETEWYILKEFYNKGLLYEGTKITPYCPRCGTGLATHEVAQGYKEVSVDSVIVTMKKKDEDVYFLVWTTTPWTLLANAAICVNPNEEYIKVQSGEYKFIIASLLANKVLGDEYEVIEKYKGKDLEYIEYEQLLPFLKSDKKGFYVTCDEYVSMEDGTGIVHTAPSFGEDDERVGKNYDLPMFNPVGIDGKYTEGPWKNTLVFDADKEVIKYLKENNRLFRKIKITHEYPHCWRCDSPLIYYATPSYYIKTTAIKNDIINANKTVNWYPKYVGEKRFSNWLENLKDWAISRTRYWGTPLPYWKCSCGHVEVIGSKQELIEKSIENIDETIELHKPYVDDIHLTCPKCGKIMNRTKEVIDCWFDSGSMPFAQYHYPFENKELWETQFPADFISEGIDQTRGWFYTLIIISVFLTGKSPYKNVLVNDLLLDAEGKKMSKSRGNVVEPFTTMKEYGADTVRWYLPYVSPVWTPLKFDYAGLKEVYSKFFNPFRNTYNFFAMYANTDEVDISECQVSYENREEIDKWLLSVYNTLLENVISYYEEYDLNKVVRAITEFVSEDLSNWYIRRNRNRFWGSTLNNSKKSVYITTYEVLTGLCQIIAPIVPYLSEEMYQKLTGNPSVHLSDFPKYNKDLINHKLEEKMTKVRNLISLGRNAREETKIKVRQPLSMAIIDGKNKKIIDDLVDLIKEELNVKELVFETNLSDYMNLQVKPNYKVCGPIFTSNIKVFIDALNKLSSEAIVKLNNNESIEILVDNSLFTVEPNMVDIKVSSKEGYDTAYLNNDFIILNTTLTNDLIEEGIARELISKIQNLRKTKDYDISDRINIFYNGNEEFKNVLNNYEQFIKAETLCKEFIFNSEIEEKYILNDIEVFLDIEKNN